jgi:hypothetical protein
MYNMCVKHLYATIIWADPELKTKRRFQKRLFGFHKRLYGFKFELMVFKTYNVV